jgi:signal transduction histidine kinase
MQNAANRMQRMIEDLLAYSRISTKAKPYQIVDLNKIGEEVASDLEIRIQETGGRVDLENLPKIEADPMQMRQLLQNLIGNALKFHLPQKPPIVKVGSRQISDDRAEIYVADNGIGFDDKNRELIFQPFKRLHGRSEYEGNGIGLAICKKIAERHGGNITANSTPGEGSTFFVTIPLCQESKFG